jgi:hypothetical protein
MCFRNRIAFDPEILRFLCGDRHEIFDTHR